MTEFIIKAADWAIDYDGNSLFKGAEEIVRCRDCKHYIDGECMVEDGNGDYLRLTVPPTHFCAWGEREIWTTCKCGEEIELGDREYAVCPACGRTVRE
jgi:hypothetical protein